MLNGWPMLCVCAPFRKNDHGSICSSPHIPQPLPWLCHRHTAAYAHSPMICCIWILENTHTQIAICWTLFFTLLPPALFNTFRLVCDHRFCTWCIVMSVDMYCLSFFYFCFVLQREPFFPTWCTCGFFMYILGSQSAAVFKLESSPVGWLNSENQVASFIF